MTWKEWEEKVDQEIKRNLELRKMFEEDPGKKDLYIKKMIDSEEESFGCRGINPEWCKTCRFSHGKPPFEDLPEKSHCMIYSYDEGVGEAKPPEVYYDGEECEYYIKQNTD